MCFRLCKLPQQRFSIISRLLGLGSVRPCGDEDDGEDDDPVPECSVDWTRICLSAPP